jgi:hypothetical protein
MPYKSITVDVSLDDFDDDDLVEELEERGYSCTRSSSSTLLTREDLLLLSRLLDTDLKNWEHTRLRDILTSMIS